MCERKEGSDIARIRNIESMQISSPISCRCNDTIISTPEKESKIHELKMRATSSTEYKIVL